MPRYNRVTSALVRLRYCVFIFYAFLVENENLQYLIQLCWVGIIQFYKDMYALQIPLNKFYGMAEIRFVFSETGKIAEYIIDSSSTLGPELEELVHVSLQKCIDNSIIPKYKARVIFELTVIHVQFVKENRRKKKKK